MARKNPPRHPPLPQAVATRCHLLLFLSSFLARGYVLLIISTVSRGADILASHTTGRRDFSNAVTTILGKIPPNDSKPTYLWKQNISSTMSLRCACLLYLYISLAYVVCDVQGTTYLILADDVAGRRLPFAYLAEVQRSFTSSYEAAYIGSVSSFHDFEPRLAELIKRPFVLSHLRALQMSHSEPDQVKDIMVHNVEQILSRGERIELLVDKTHYLCVHLWFIRRISLLCLLHLHRLLFSCFEPLFPLVRPTALLFRFRIPHVFLLLLCSTYHRMAVPRLFANRCRCSLPSIITFVGDNYSLSLSLRIARHRLRALRAPCCVIPAPTLVRRLYSSVVAPYIV
ncbi:hypothetical protein BKA62DRAFT_629843 [Auriculariales sp. MPI-PUGE-AT-0066]|nr:hypothetical protein BKA62DRAFT_629843 [Auriculariales sp. MPI-PUGE-AT-0066]